MPQSPSKLLSSLDAFGQPIALHFKGSYSFNTPCGGMITLVKNIIVTWLVLETLSLLINQEYMTIQTYGVGDLPPTGQLNLF